MSKKESDYSKNIIYKIICNDLIITDIYIGHTTNFINRKYTHQTNCNNINNKNYNYKVYKIIRDNGGWDNWKMLEIEKYPCNDKNEALERERYYIELLNANLNIRVPKKTNDEIKEFRKKYKEINREIIILKHREYNKLNKDKQKLYRETNKEKIAIQQQKYNEINKDKLSLQRKKYRENNKEKKKEYDKLYRELKKKIIYNIILYNE